MFKLEAHDDTSLRFYGEDICVLSRRNGARRIVSGELAAMFWYLDKIIGVDGVNQLGVGMTPPTPETEKASAIVQQVFKALDDTKPVTSKVALMKRCPKLLEVALQKNLPLTALLEISYQCNLACDHCYILHEVVAENPARLKTDQIRETIENVAHLGALDITISGGEPTLDKRYRDFVRLAKDLHITTTLKTNAATFTRKNAEIYARDPAHSTELSIYGADAQTHDAITTVRGSLEKTLAGMEALKEAGITCQVLCIVWKGNAEQLQETKDLVEAAGHRINFSDVIYGRLDGDKHPIDLRIDQRQREKLIDAGFIQPFVPSPCTAGQTKIKVSAHGEISICELLPHGFGNIKDRPLSEIWHERNTRSYSDKIVGLSTSERSSSGLPILSCPGLNLLAEGQLEGKTTI